MANDLASDLKSGGFAKLGHAVDPKTSGDAVKAASDSLGKIGSKIQDFYKKSIGIKSPIGGAPPGTMAKYKAQHKKDNSGS
jgi:hypothetical protein